MSTEKFMIANELAEFASVTPRIIAFLGAQAIPSMVAYAARAAAEELVVNIIRYAFDDALRHEIVLEIRVEPGRVLVRVEDDGRPFDPSSVQPPDLVGSIESRQVGGWGVHLVRAMSDEIRYERCGAFNRVEVRIPVPHAAG